MFSFHLKPSLLASLISAPRDIFLVRPLSWLTFVFCLTLIPGFAQATHYKYTFRNGVNVIIGAATTNPNGPKSERTDFTYIDQPANPDSEERSLNEDVNNQFGLKESYFVHNLPVESLILFGAYRKNHLSNGQAVDLPVTVLPEHSMRLQDNQEAIVLVNSRSDGGADLVVVTSLGRIFKFAVLNRARPDTKVEASDIIDDLLIWGGYQHNQRVILGVSIKSPLGDVSLLTSTRLTSGNATWSDGPGTIKEQIHIRIPGFYSDLEIKPTNTDAESGFQATLRSPSIGELSAPIWIVTQPSSSNPLAALPKSANDKKSITNTEAEILQFSASEKLAALQEFDLVTEKGSDGKSHHYLERASDRKRVHIHIGELENPGLLADGDGRLYVRGVEREVSIENFDFESSYRLHPAKPTIEFSHTSEGQSPIQHVEKVVEESFERWSPNPLEEYSFTSDELARVEDAKTRLQNRDIKSFVLLGSAGTGKSTLINEVFRSLPNTWSVYRLDTASLLSGTGLRGSMEARIKALTSLAKLKPVILFVDEIHTLKGAGGNALDGAPDILQMLKTSLSTGQLIVVGTDTRDEYLELIKSDDALKRRLPSIEMPPLNARGLELKLRSRAQSLGLTQVTDSFLKTLIKLAAAGLPHLNEPARSATVLDQVIVEIERSSNGPLNEAELNPDAIRSVLSKMTRLRFTLPEARAYLKESRQKYQSKIVGDDAALEPLFRQVESGWMGAYMGKGPMVRLLLTGPAGVGKSDRATVYAEAMGLPHLFISPSMFQGGPQMVVSQIADALEKDPFTVLVLDEIEKYPQEFRDVLLNLLSNNTLTVTDPKANRVRTVYTRFASVIATSNAGEAAIESMTRQMVINANKRSIGFMTEAPQGSVPMTLSFSSQQYEAILREELGTYLVDRFPVQTTVVRIDRPDEDTLRKILRLRTAEKLRQLRNGNFLGVKVDVPKVENLVEAILIRATEEGLGIRAADALLAEAVDEYYRTRIESGKYSPPWWAPLHKPKSANSCKGLFE